MLKCCVEEGFKQEQAQKQICKVFFNFFQNQSKVSYAALLFKLFVSIKNVLIFCRGKNKNRSERKKEKTSLRVWNKTSRNMSPRLAALSRFLVKVCSGTVAVDVSSQENTWLHSKTKL